MSNRGTRAFTLIELLVVMAIIGILAGIVLPVFAAARAKARQTTCMSQMKQLALAATMWAQDYGEKLPSANNWSIELADYVPEETVSTCPDAPEGTKSYSINDALAGRSLAVVDTPSNTVLFYEGGGGVTIEASGEWTSGGWTGDAEGQDDQPPTASNFLLPGSKPYALIGRIGDGSSFYIGSRFTGSVDRAGYLILSMNDVPGIYWDNAGTLTVSVTIGPNPTQIVEVSATEPWSCETGIWLDPNAVTPKFQYVANRHRNGSNMSFVDGHVRWYPTKAAPQNESTWFEQEITFNASYSW